MLRQIMIFKFRLEPVVCLRQKKVRIGNGISGYVRLVQVMTVYVTLYQFISG